MSKPPRALPEGLQPKPPHSRVTPHGRLHVHLVVSDMKRSIDFYTTTLGFFYDHGVRDAAWLTHDSLLLTISPGEPQQTVSAYFGWCIEDFGELEALYERLYRGGCRLGAPPARDADRMYFFLYDPDDYPVVFSYQQFDYPKVYAADEQATGEVEVEDGEDSLDNGPGPLV